VRLRAALVAFAFPQVGLQRLTHNLALRLWHLVAYRDLPNLGLACFQERFIAQMNSGLYP
jgi:hypothetical protein